LRIRARVLLVLGIGLFCLTSLRGDENPLLVLEGKYLVYSYDFNQILGRDVSFEWAGYTVSCLRFKADINARLFQALGRVKLVQEESELLGDELVFDPEKKMGTLLRYGERIERVILGGEEGAEEAALPQAQMQDLTLEHVQSSLIYCTSLRIELTAEYEVFGYDVMFYVESLPSVSFTKFKLSKGLARNNNGFSLDKFWYTRSQGLIGNASFRYVEDNVINTMTSLRYEERSILKDFIGPPRQADITHVTSLVYNPSTTLGFNGNYNSSRLWNANVWVNKKWSDVITTNFDFALNKPVNFKGEAWFGAQAVVAGGRYGDLSLAARSDMQEQLIGNLSYGTSLFKRLNVLLDTNYTKLKVSGSDQGSEILSGSLSLSHLSRVFNLAADYYLNHDLLGSETLSRPQLRLGINPLTFYGGLLSVQLTNILIYNRISAQENQENTYSNNTVFYLSTETLDLPQGLHLNVRLSAEQFLEKKGRHFTSGGLILNLTKDLVPGVFFETFYSTQSRRRTQNWLIEGTTSQDLSLILRANPKPWLNGWISVSYDPKSGRWQQSFADLSVSLLRNWRFHSLLNYDFLLGKLSNVDLYLIRDAGRFQLKFVWRSLSKQFLVELIPL
jgi:hypothetical protein